MGTYLSLRELVQRCSSQCLIEHQQGALWTIPPCDPAAAERAGKQMVRMGVTGIRRVQKARLLSGGKPLDVVIFTRFPIKQQTVLLLGGGVVKISTYLQDDSTKILEVIFGVKASDEVAINPQTIVPAPSGAIAEIL